MTLTFTHATKEAAKARLALAGPSGSGKTWTALVVATVLAEGGKIALIDTERGSAAKYSDAFSFDTLALHSYAPTLLPEALAVAAEAGYPVAVVDSLSHFWSGKDGMLQQVDRAAKRSGGGNSFAGWKDARPMEQAMIDALLAYPGHVIVTMRTKTEWIVEADSRGKQVPRRVGTKPEQRDGIEYEFDLVGDMDLDNTLVISKSRCPSLSSAVVTKPGADFGQAILDWLTDGEAAPSAMDLWDKARQAEDLDAVRAVYTEVDHRGLTGASVKDGDITGTLGELIVNWGKQMQAAAK